MSPETEFKSGVVAPVECLKEGWEMVKGSYWLFLGICAVGMMIGNAFAIVLMGPMMCGIFLCFFQQMRGEQVSFEGLFKGFDYFGQSVIATLIQAIPAAIIILPTCFIMVVAVLGVASSGSSREAEETMAFMFTMGILVVFLVCMLLGIILGIFFIFTFPLIVDRELSGVEAVKTSIKAARANFGGIFGLVLLNVLLSFAGLFVCYVGAFLVMPITLAAQAIAYRRVFPEMLVTSSSPSSPPPPPPPGSWGDA
jgi:uncharacterized membrane protein